MHHLLSDIAQYKLMYLSFPCINGKGIFIIVSPIVNINLKLLAPIFVISNLILLYIGLLSSIKYVWL